VKKKLLDYLGNAVYVGLFIISIIVVIVLHCLNFIDTEKITWTSISSGLIAIIGLILFYERLKNQGEQVRIQGKQVQIQGEQIQIQIKQRVDERFNSAINLLGSSETSARTNAVYTLHELALEDDRYCQQIVQILCSHIRSKTNEEAYQETHKERPSNEIQTTLNLLFKKHKHGLYAQDFAKQEDFPWADLSHAYLVKADFRYAQCQGASFKYAQCQGADFEYAQCQGADFRDAQCQGANFRDAQCQGANFDLAQCQEVNFYRAQCQGASFKSAECQGANFRDAQCQGADFWVAQCQGASFRYAQCQGADFISAKCQGVYTLKEVYSQELSSRIGEDTEFETLQLEGKIDKDVIKNIENAKNYFSDSKYRVIQAIIQYNKSKEPKYGTPEDCITGILENSEQLQSIIEKDWEKLEQLNKKQHD
jgi:uncharacterized protein YjbI with pentapeptide repeats